MSSFNFGAPLEVTDDAGSRGEGATAHESGEEAETEIEFYTIDDPNVAEDMARAFVNWIWGSAAFANAVALAYTNEDPVERAVGLMVPEGVVNADAVSEVIRRLKGNQSVYCEELGTSAGVDLEPVDEEVIASRISQYRQALSSVTPSRFDFNRGGEGEELGEVFSVRFPDDFPKTSAQSFMEMELGPPAVGETSPPTIARAIAMFGHWIAGLNSRSAAELGMCGMGFLVKYDSVEVSADESGGTRVESKVVEIKTLTGDDSMDVLSDIVAKAVSSHGTTMATVGNLMEGVSESTVGRGEQRNMKRRTPGSGEVTKNKMNKVLSLADYCRSSPDDIFNSSRGIAPDVVNRSGSKQPLIAIDPTRMPIMHARHLLRPFLVQLLEGNDDEDKTQKALEALTAIDWPRMNKTPESSGLHKQGVKKTSDSAKLKAMSILPELASFARDLQADLQDEGSRLSKTIAESKFDEAFELVLYSEVYGLRYTTGLTTVCNMNAFEARIQESHIASALQTLYDDPQAGTVMSTMLPGRIGMYRAIVTIASYLDVLPAYLRDESSNSVSAAIKLTMQEANAEHPLAEHRRVPVKASARNLEKVAMERARLAREKSLKTGASNPVPALKAVTSPGTKAAGSKNWPRYGVPVKGSLPEVDIGQGLKRSFGGVSDPSNIVTGLADFGRSKNLGLPVYYALAIARVVGMLRQMEYGDSVRSLITVGETRLQDLLAAVPWMLADCSGKIVVEDEGDAVVNMTGNVQVPLAPEYGLPLTTAETSGQFSDLPPVRAHVVNRRGIAKSGAGGNTVAVEVEEVSEDEFEPEERPPTYTALLNIVVETSDGRPPDEEEEDHSEEDEDGSEMEADGSEEDGEYGATLEDEGGQASVSSTPASPDDEGPETFDQAASGAGSSPGPSYTPGGSTPVSFADENEVFGHPNGAAGLPYGRDPNSSPYTSDFGGTSPDATPPSSVSSTPASSASSTPASSASSTPASSDDEDDQASVSSTPASSDDKGDEERPAKRSRKQ